MRLLAGLNILGAVGLRKGALGIPLRGAMNIETSSRSISNGVSGELFGTSNKTLNLLNEYEL